MWLWQLTETTLADNPLSDNQHAFRKGFSTESALSNMVEYVEKAFVQKGYALGVYLDIKGAFDNIPTTSIIRGMQAKNFPPIFISWYKHLLTNRTIEVAHQGVTQHKHLNLGTPQGGVLSPLAWNLAFEGLLELFENGPVKICGFADDAGLIITGHDPIVLARHMQHAVDRAVQWGTQNGLQFSAPKSVAVLFTRKYKKVTPPCVKLGGAEIPYSPSARYLGVTLDNKLFWKEHIKNKIKTAKYRLMTTRSAIGKLWGPAPKAMLWLYSGIIRPALSYGALVWVGATTRLTTQQNLRKVNRLALLTLGHFRQGTPTAGLEIITYTPPLHLWLQMEAACAYRRTMGHRKLRAQDLQTNIPRNFGHRQICADFLESLGWQEEGQDSITTKFNWEQEFDLDRDSFTLERATATVAGRQHIEVFTDGSRVDGLAGAGFYFLDKTQELDVTECSFHLGQTTTVFQAELFALTKAAEYITENAPPNQEAYIFVDSQAALKAVGANFVTSRSVSDCIAALNRAAAGRRLTLRWVKAHVGIHNEKAAMRKLMLLQKREPKIRSTQLTSY